MSIHGSAESGASSAGLAARHACSAQLPYSFASAGTGRGKPLYNDMLFMFFAAAALQAAPAVPAPTLQNISGVKVHYYDVQGVAADTIKASLDSAIRSQPKTAGQLFTWTATASVQNDSQGGSCTVTSAKALLDANVYLPRLTDEARVPPDVLERWKAYEGGLEQTAVADLAFVADRLPAIEQSLTGKKCDDAANIWNEAIKKLTADEQAFDRKNNRSSNNPAQGFRY